MAKKKNKNKPVVVSFLLDRTGSMQAIKDDVIGGYNQFISEQKKLPGKCSFLFTQFDSQSIDHSPLLDITSVPELTSDTYQPRASTPLLDAIGVTVRHAQGLVSDADRVLFVVYTDGYENASREFTRETVKQLVEERTKAGWEFIFLGAGIDAYAESRTFGVAATQTVSTSPQQTPGTFAAVGQSVSSYRSGDTGYMDSLKKEEQNQSSGTNTNS